LLILNAKQLKVGRRTQAIGQIQYISCTVVEGSRKGKWKLNAGPSRQGPCSTRSGWTGVFNQQEIRIQSEFTLDG